MTEPSTDPAGHAQTTCTGCGKVALLVVHSDGDPPWTCGDGEGATSPQASTDRTAPARAAAFAGIDRTSPCESLHLVGSPRPLTLSLIAEAVREVAAHECHRFDQRWRDLRWDDDGGRMFE